MNDKYLIIEQDEEENYQDDRLLLEEQAEYEEEREKKLTNKVIINAFENADFIPEILKKIDALDKYILDTHGISSQSMFLLRDDTVVECLKSIEYTWWLRQKCFTEEQYNYYQMIFEAAKLNCQIL